MYCPNDGALLDTDECPEHTHGPCEKCHTVWEIRWITDNVVIMTMVGGEMIAPSDQYPDS